MCKCIYLLYRDDSKLIPILYREQTKKKASTYIHRPMKSLIMNGVTLRQEAVQTIDSDNSQIVTKEGNRYQYNFLVVCPGVSLRWDKIEGAKEACEDPNSPVASIYRLDYAYKAS